MNKAPDGGFVFWKSRNLHPMHATSVTGHMAGPPLRRRSDALIALGLVCLLALVAAVFWPAIHGPFVFDDFPNLKNLQLLDGKLDAAHFRQYIAAFTGAPGRPLSGLSFAIEDYAWPSEPLAFKRNNILLHMLTGVLIFALARQLGRLHPPLAARADVLALAAAAAWLLHPMQLSTMMLVVQRMTILSNMFIVAGMLGYLASLRCTRLPPLSRALLAGGALAGFGLLALLSKENGVLIFAYATVLNLTFLRPGIAELPTFPRRLLQWGAAAPMLLLAVLAAANIHRIAGSYGARDFTLGERLLTQSRILIDYLRQILLPRIGGQGIFHDDYPISHGVFDPPITFVAILLLAALAVAAWRVRARAPAFAFAVLWFFAGHLIESTVVPLELYFEHRNYLAMFGPLLAVVAMVMTVPTAYRKMGWVAFALWLGLATSLSAYNATTWGDRGKLASVWLQENPRSIRAIQFMAGYQFDSGEQAAAVSTFKNGLAMLPEAEQFRFQQALTSCLGTGISKTDVAELQLLASTVSFSRVIPDILSVLRTQALGGDRCGGAFSPEDFEILVNRLLKNPTYSHDSATLGYLHYELAKVAKHDRDLDRLMYHLDKSHAYRPDPAVPREQAIHLLTAGLPDDALRYLDISDSTPQPLLKRWLVDVAAYNAPLRNSAIEMRKQFRHSDVQIRPLLLASPAPTTQEPHERNAAAQ